MSDSEEEELDESQFTCANPDVVTKYKIAADCTNKALEVVLEACKPGAKVVDLCVLGDKTITDEVARYYNKKDKDGNKVEKGIAFPTCISVNACVCHNSPPADDDAVLEEGQSVKIDLGSHIDGYIATLAHTVVLQGDMNAPVTGAQADVMKAVQVAGEAAIRKLRPGLKNTDVGVAIEKVAEEFGVSVCEGVLTHNMKRFVIDGNKVVLNKSSPELRADEEDVELNEVYALDIVFSSGEGKPKLLNEKETMVYKRAIENKYNLKMQASRAVYSEISKKYPTMPFPARALDEKRANLGLVECLNHGLLHAYPVLYEKQGEAVAHFKATVLVMQNGNDRITKWEPSNPLESEKELQDEELKELIAQPLKSKKKKNKKKGGDADA